jgi:hypothetical protein
MSVSTRISVWVLHCLAKCLAVALPLFLSLLRAQCCSARTRRIAPKGDNWAGKGRGRCCWRPPWRARSTPSTCRGRWWTSAPWPTVCATAWYSTRAVTLNEDTAAGSVIAIRMQYCTFNSAPLERSRGALIVPRSAASLPIQLRLVHLIYHLTLRVGVQHVGAFLQFLLLQRILGVQQVRKAVVPTATSRWLPPAATTAPPHR